MRATRAPTPRCRTSSVRSTDTLGGDVDSTSMSSIFFSVMYNPDSLHVEVGNTFLSMLR